MQTQRSIRDTLRDFCGAWFARRDASGVLEFFTKDVCFVGTGENELARGKDEMAAYLRQDMREIPEPFSYELSFLQEQSVAEKVYNAAARLVLKNSLYTWHLRGYFTLVQSDDRWLIQSLYFSEPGGSQRGQEHYPRALVMENIVRQRQELLNDSLAGGMMGGYIEEGFPFYFINRQMLDYLGYADEAEFVADIGGRISNCMHPDDRKAVDEEVARQLERNDEYVVEYRMKKRDGTYIWVHDLGRKTTAEDGRPAIASVCIDITAQKEAQDEILRIYNNIPGAVFRCRFDPGFTVIDANDGLFDFLGYTRAEFLALGSSMASVMTPEDLRAMTGQLTDQLRDGNAVRIENRLVCKGGAVKWISLKAQLFQEKDGEPCFYCVFVDITDEKRLQERIRELYEQELAYFSELSSEEGSIQGRFNLTRNRLESYISTSNVAIASMDATYDENIARFAATAVDEAFGQELLRALDRDKVLADYAAGKADYHFDFLRRGMDGGDFWGSTSFRSTQNPETGDVMLFFYTSDITEKKLQEELHSRYRQGQRTAEYVF